jgi:hypothetical protein
MDFRDGIVFSRIQNQMSNVEFQTEKIVIIIIWSYKI